MMAQSEAHRKRQDEARKALEENREERKKLNEEAMKRMDSAKPTPTQEENDLAKLGVPKDKLDDDGSGQTVITTTVVANEPLRVGGYSARPREKRE
jgi:hypothetical protein